MSILILILLVTTCSAEGLTVREYSEPLDRLQNDPLIIQDDPLINATREEMAAVSRINCTEYIEEEEYVILRNGSLFIPGSYRTHDPKTFVVANGTAYVCVEARVNHGRSIPHNFSDTFTNCAKLLIDAHEYRLLDSQVVFIEIYNRRYDPRDYYITDEGVYVCIPEFNEMDNVSRSDGIVQKFGVEFGYVSDAGLLISIVALLMHLIVFCVVPSVRNLPNSCLASLSLSLLVAYCCYIAGSNLTGVSCAPVGISIYYFFLSSFFWMNIIAFDVWRSFRVVASELRISTNRMLWRKFLVYSLYSWGVPACLAAVVMVADSTDLMPDDLKPNFGSSFCWFGKRKALFLFFATPLIVLMILNIGFFIDVAYVISKATLKTSATLKKRFFIFTKLALIMGLTWIVGLVAGYMDTAVLWYLFIVLNTLQGLFIFVVFSCGSKVREIFCRRYARNAKSRGSTSIRTISQISATV